MRVLLLSRTLPAPTGVGSSVHVWSLIESLVDKGHQVRLCLSSHPSQVEDWRARMFDKSGGELSALGVDVQYLKAPQILVDTRLVRLLRLFSKTLAPSLEDFYPEVKLESQLKEQVESWGPDALCLWEIEAVAAGRYVAQGLPRLAFFTDPDHLIRRNRRRYRRVRNFRDRFYRAVESIAERDLESRMVELLRECDVVIDHAAHHAEWFRNNGVTQTVYLPVPVIDRIGDDWSSARAEKAASKNHTRISLIGNLNGVATVSGLRVFADSILPMLVQTLGEAPFEVHVIGGGDLPSDLARKLAHPCVHLRGYVDDVHAEFLSSDVLLVPTDSEMGFRTRIAEGLSFGCCVVAHKANAYGMPELQNGRNSLLGSSGTELAELVARCVRDPALRLRLGRNGRETFVAGLDGKLICGRMIDLLEAAVDRRRNEPPFIELRERNQKAAFCTTETAH